jgi:hypothetical protein
MLETDEAAGNPRRIETKIPRCESWGFVLVGRKNLPANGRKLPPERCGYAENVSRFCDRRLARALLVWRRQIGKVVTMNINSAVRSYFPPGGSQGVSAFSSAGAGDTTSSSLDARANAASGVTTYDFSQMSRSQMQGVAQGLYKSGQIDLAQLGMLQQAGPIGKVGPNGEFVPFTAAERADIDSRPVNYLHLLQGAIAGIESRGEATDPRSGCNDWKHILAALRANQGSVSGVDISA